MLQGNISKDEVLENPDAVLDVLEFQSNIIKKENQQPSASSSASTSPPAEPSLPAERVITLSTHPGLPFTMWPKTQLRCVT